MAQLKLTFRWNGEEAMVLTSDYERVMNSPNENDGDWITGADFLKDVAHAAGEAYEDYLKRHLTPKGGHRG